MVNELVCFVLHKLELMPPDSITQMCTSCYDDDTIETAARLIFDLCADPNNREDRYKRRPGDRKKLEFVQDIISLIQRRGNALTVDLVMQDLSNLPPVSFDNIDVSVVLSKIERMKANMDILQSAVETQTEVCDGLRQRTDDLSTQARPPMLRGTSPSVATASSSSPSTPSTGLTVYLPPTVPVSAGGSASTLPSVPLPPTVPVSAGGSGQSKGKQTKVMRANAAVATTPASVPPDDRATTPTPSPLVEIWAMVASRKRKPPVQPDKRAGCLLALDRLARPAQAVKTNQLLLGALLTSASRVRNVSPTSSSHDSIQVCHLVS